MNKKQIIKIFGLYHSGTNFLSFLLKYNFDHHVCEGFCGWKHSYIYDLDAIDNISVQINEDINVIFCVRNPYDWIWRFINLHYDFVFNSLQMPVYCQTHFSQEFYENIVIMYNKKLENYKSFIEKNNSMFVRYEDLANNQILTLENIEKKYNLKRSQENLLTFYKKINPEERIEGDTYVASLKNYKENFTIADINFINKNLDTEILDYFGYSASV
jgi:hypothetical protein